MGLLPGSSVPVSGLLFRKDTGAGPGISGCGSSRKRLQLYPGSVSCPSGSSRAFSGGSRDRKPHELAGFFSWEAWRAPEGRRASAGGSLYPGREPVFIKRNILAYGLGKPGGRFLEPAALAGLFFKRALREKERGRERFLVRLFYRGGQREFKALADSGNRLREPVSGKPVSVVYAGDLKGFCDSVDGVVYIPYRAVGTRAGPASGRDI